MVAITHLSFQIPAAAQDSATDAYVLLYDNLAGTMWRVAGTGINTWTAYNRDAHEEFSLALVRQGAGSTHFRVALPANAAFLSTNRRISVALRVKALAGSAASAFDEQGEVQSFFIEGGAIYSAEDTAAQIAMRADFSTIIENDGTGAARFTAAALANGPVGGGGGGGGTTFSNEEGAIVIESGMTSRGEVEISADAWTEFSLVNGARVHWAGVISSWVGTAQPLPTDRSSNHDQSQTPGENPIICRPHPTNKLYIRAGGSGQKINVWN